jgi:hypothetical protein
MALKSNKKRAVISYENMPQELRDAFEKKYPHGYADYMGDIFKVDKPNGTFFHAVSVETEDAIYLVKIQVRTDALEDIENGLFKDSADDETADGDGTFPDSDNDFGDSGEDDVD